jgi:hypothetical protein
MTHKTQPVYARFARGISSYWQRHAVDRSLLEQTGETLRLVNVDASADTYTNAQIDDYAHLPRPQFPWRPPLRFSVRARFSHPGAHESGDGERLVGTAGFGFWNDPFLMMSLRVPALPRALWFFYASPPSNMKLDLDTPGWGWKAATIDAARLPFLLLAPTAPLALPLMWMPPIYRKLWPVAQRAMKVSERGIDVALRDWHIYGLDWGTHTVRFSVDGRPILSCDTSPRGPLGLVIWIDNQYMQVTPQGRIRHGLIAKPGRQWLELDWLAVEPYPEKH